jgi:ABC-type phosphate transport system substrate-binding protein
MKRIGIAALVAALFGAACSVLLNHDKTQCATDSDCAHFGGHPSCVSGTCVESGLGPSDCFEGTPMGSSDFENQCSVATCGDFDNCARIGLCGSDGTEPATVVPPDAAPASTVDAPTPPPMPLCVDPTMRNTVVLSGSTEAQPFLSVIAPLLAAESPPYQIAYQPSGSCTGVDQMMDPNPAKRIVKDIVGKQALLFNTDGTSQACTFGSGVSLDVAVSDVFSTTCNATFTLGSAYADYHGPIEPMVMVVPSSSDQTTISAEMTHVVFGAGNSYNNAAPWTDPTLYFVRNSSSGTQNMISHAVNINAAQWWGIDRGSTGNVVSEMEAVSPTQAEQAIGIMSTDFADAQRSRLRILAFKATDQECAYYPDSTLFTRDKQNVRDGHYGMWGPMHFIATVTNGEPSAAAGALVTKFTLTRPDQPMLDAITAIGFVPDCAMGVTRTVEMGPLSVYSPDYQCHCYFEATVPTGAAGSDCIPCTGPTDCPSATPACNNGYCEVQ